MANTLTGEQKAAILLRAIGEEAAAQVMKQLDPKEIKKLGSFMSGTAQISREDEEVVISDFQAASAADAVSSPDVSNTILSSTRPSPSMATRL